MRLLNAVETSNKTFHPDLWAPSYRAALAAVWSAPGATSPDEAWATAGRRMAEAVERAPLVGVGHLIIELTRPLDALGFSDWIRPIWHLLPQGSANIRG